MPDENGTEATQDAQNAYESLFGDEAAKPVAVAEEAEEKEADNETDREPQGSDIGEDQTGGAESDPGENEAGGDESVPPEHPADNPATEAEGNTADDMKVVVSIRKGSATIGVQRPSSDPHIESFDDAELSGLAAEVTAVIERARARWEEAPRYPSYARPVPVKRRRRRGAQASPQDSAAEQEADQEEAQALRLF